MASGKVSVLGLDPGGTTGWAVATVNIEAIQTGNIISGLRYWSTGNLVGGIGEQVEALGSLFDSWPDAAIVAESFDTNRQAAFEVDSIEVNGGIKYLTWCDCREHKLFWQTPAFAKTTVTDELLHKWKLYRPGQDHGRDALRHCLTFLRRCAEDLELAWRAWPKAFASLSVG